MTSQPAIVVATDLSARSDRPFDRAVQIARERNGRLILVHAIEGDIAAQRAGRLDAARDIINRMTASFEVPVDLVLAEQPAPQLIADTAEKVSADLIVVGPARYNHVTDFFLGTAVDFLLRNAPCPVLVVKERVARAYDRLIVGTDYSGISAEALVTAAALLPQLPITVLHAYRPAFPSRLGEENSMQIGEEAARDGLVAFKARAEVARLSGRTTFELVPESTEVALDKAAAQSAMPLVAIGAHGTGGFVQATLGSRASELIAAVPHDMLVVRRGLQPGN